MPHRSPQHPTQPAKAATKVLLTSPLPLGELIILGSILLLLATH